MARGEDSPAMKHFRELKEAHGNAVLLYQIGDFFETFFDDAKEIARVLGITLTSRGEQLDGQAIPMAGFPLRALDQHLPRLLEAGLRVVVCEQTEDSALAKGLVKREVTRVITPGTVTEDSLLDARKANIIAAWIASGKSGGLAWAELATGRFLCTTLSRQDLPSALARLEPAELLLTEAYWSRERDELNALRALTSAALTAVPDFSFDEIRAISALKAHFGVQTLAGFGFENSSGIELAAAGALLSYLQENQRGKLAHLRNLERFEPSSVMALDRATLDALEVVATLRGRERRGSLLDCIDETCTSMGARELRSWLVNPQTELRHVSARHAAVEELVRTPRRLKLVRDALDGLPDIERLAGKVGAARALPRDLAALREALTRLPLIRNAAAGAESSLLAYAGDTLDTLDDLRGLLAAHLADDPPQTVRDGGAIREGVSAELDELRALGRDGKAFIARFQEEEARRSGIGSLKVGYNSVFGYYIEVTHAQSAKIPANYIRKQTLKGAERYITPELKDYESKILNAERRIQSLEAELFARLREQAAGHCARLTASARLIAMLDALAGFAQVAHTRGWVRPHMDESRELRLVDARHPLLERALDPGKVVPNDCDLGDDRPMAIVTGPNMAGKSTYVRTVALCVLLAQAGSFVPAREARLGLCDRVFTRLGSADDIGRGASTFMVEMAETANILNHATARSLIVLDEVGRGTSTYDGVSLAWAISEYILGELGARTVFATHYHELTQLAHKFTGARNLNVAVREWNDELIFLHKIVEGGADRSYGIHVAKLAGIPHAVVQRGREILAKLEADSPSLAGGQASHTPPRDNREAPLLRRPKAVQLSLFTINENAAIRALRSLDLSSMTPEQALAELLRLQKLARE